MFVDKVKVFLKAGNGGAGCVSFRREKWVPKGGPDGGEGGHGGSIYIQANNRLKTLLDLYHHPHIHAKDGERGEGSNRSGKSGKDITISVPTGTVIKYALSDAVIADLVNPDEPILLAQGGGAVKGMRGLQLQPVNRREYLNPENPEKRKP